MIERFLTQTHFTSEEDYRKNLHFNIPENFNFAYDVMDVWAEEQPDKVALIWTNDEGEEKIFTFADIKRESDQTAAYFASLGIGHGDMVMIILKRRYEWWLTMLALHKLGAIAIPATHMLTKHDIVYRNNRASVRAIVCVGEEYVLTQVSEAMSESPTVHTLISVGPEVPDGFHDWHKEWKNAPAFVRPNHVNTNDDTTTPLQTLHVDDSYDLGGKNIYIVRLTLSDSNGKVLSTNTYVDSNDHGNLQDLNTLPVLGENDIKVSVETVACKDAKKACSQAQAKGCSAQAQSCSAQAAGCNKSRRVITLENTSKTPAMMVRLNLLDGDGDQILPVDYSDNYFHLLPGEKRTIKVAWNNEDMRKGNPVVDVTGFNVK